MLYNQAPLHVTHLVLKEYMTYLSKLLLGMYNFLVRCGCNVAPGLHMSVLCSFAAVENIDSFGIQFTCYNTHWELVRCGCNMGNVVCKKVRIFRLREDKTILRKKTVFDFQCPYFFLCFPNQFPEWLKRKK